MSTLVAFTPSTTAAFTFQPTLNGTQYNATITYNIFGQRYYLNLTDLAGNLVLCTALVSSGPRLQATFTWTNGVATVSTMANHNVPVGAVANVRISQTDTLFDGGYRALATGPTTLTYALVTNPNEAEPVLGIASFPLNLTPGLGWLVFYEDTQQFEYASATT